MQSQIYNNIEIKKLVHEKHRIIYCVINDEIRIGAVLNASNNLDTAIKYIHRFFI